VEVLIRRCVVENKTLTATCPAQGRRSRLLGLPPYPGI
jgi:rRNA maturation protein Nop10